MHMGFGLKRADDPPLYARRIKRIRKGLYRVELHHASGRKFDADAIFHAANVAQALEQCKRLYPTVTRRVTRRVR